MLDISQMIISVGKKVLAHAIAARGQRGTPKERAGRFRNTLDRQAALGNGTAFSAVAPASGPLAVPIDPLDR
jgi:hypothetical protein